MISVITNTGLTSTSTATYSTISNNKYKNPADIAMLYRYRFTILDFDRIRYAEIQRWCKENCLRRVEVLIVPINKNQYACICAFEKKIDCVGFKLWW